VRWGDSFYNSLKSITNPILLIVYKRDSNELSSLEFDLNQVTTSSNQNRSKLECWLAWICKKEDSEAVDQNCALLASACIFEFLACPARFERATCALEAGKMI
jgi:hypothetical protein